jgi:hypothetical protein
MWNEKKLMERNGSGMKVVESLWNGTIENCYGMGWKWNPNFQHFGPLMHISFSQLRFHSVLFCLNYNNLFCMHFNIIYV